MVSRCLLYFYMSDSLSLWCLAASFTLWCVWLPPSLCIWCVWLSHYVSGRVSLRWRTMLPSCAVSLAVSLLGHFRTVNLGLLYLTRQSLAMPLASMNSSVHSITSFRFRFVAPSFRRVTTTCATRSQHYQHGVHIYLQSAAIRYKPRASIISEHNQHAYVSGIVARFVTSYFLGKSSSLSIAKEPLIAHCLNFPLLEFPLIILFGQSAWYTPSLRWTRLRLKNPALWRSMFRLTEQ